MKRKTEKQKTGEQRTTYKNGSSKKRWLAVLIAAGVLIATVLVVLNWESFAPEALLDWTDAQFGEGEAGEGYPCSISGNTVVGMGEVNSYLAILSDTSIRFLNGTAGCVATRSYAYTDPLLLTEGRYALVVEIGGNRFQLETRRSTVLSQKLEGRTLYTADLLSSGMIAVVTSAASQNYLCAIQVYNLHGKQLYEYKSSKYLINSVSLYPGGRGMAAVGTTAEGGAAKSVLLNFQFSSKEPTEYAGNDLMLYKVRCFSSGTVLAVGDKELWTLKRGASSVEKTALDSHTVVGFSASRTLAGLVLQQSGSSGGGTFWLINSSGVTVRTHTFVGAFRSVFCGDTDALLLTDSLLFVINRKDAPVQITTPADSLMAMKYRGKYMLLTLSEIQQLSK